MFDKLLNKLKIKQEKKDPKKTIDSLFDLKVKYTYEVDWDLISTTEILSENFIRDFKEDLNWVTISSKQNLSEHFILEFSDYVNWQNISRNKKLSCNFIVSKLAKLELEDIYMNENIKLSREQKNDLEKLYKIKNLFRT